MKKYFALVSFDILWILGFISILILSLSPIIFSMKLAYEHITYQLFYLLIPVAVFVWLNLYVLSAGVLKFILVPNLKEGAHRMPGKEWIKWRLTWMFYSYVFLFCNRYVLFNKYIKTLFFKLMGAKLHYTTYLGETADFQDVNNLLQLGKNTLVASEVILATHLIISVNIIKFKKIIIGDNSLISARCSLAPGVLIENDVIVGYNASISFNVSIGEKTKIEGDTIIHADVKIGKNCRIGSHVIIERNAIIPDNTKIPNYTIWKNKTKEN